MTLAAHVDTAVVGAGQAGLTMSWYLQRAGRDHVVLERRESLGGGWQDRWDSFQLVGPNWTVSFPDAPYNGTDPDGFMTRSEIAGRVAGYARTINAPVVLSAGVERVVGSAGGGFELRTAAGAVRANQVVVATGGFQAPHVPPLAAALPPKVLSMHSHFYRREADLPPGAVLIVGSGQTGVQLTEELCQAGREVYLCVGSAGRVPRKYRGRDIFFWLGLLAEHGEKLGVELPIATRLPDPRRRLAANPALSGHHGGHEVDLRDLARAGATLLGRLTAVTGTVAQLGADLPANLEHADHFFAERFQGRIEALIAAAGVDCPPAELAMGRPFVPELRTELDLAAAGVSTVIWATGYRPDLSWIDLPICDDFGYPRQLRGVGQVPGLFFLGTPWLHDQLSASLLGLPRDARVLARGMGLPVTPPEPSVFLRI